MVRLLLLIFSLFFAHTSFSQDEEKPILFSEALSEHLPKYEKKAKAAYRYRNFEKAQFLFDSLVEYGLTGTVMDDFKFKRLNSKEITLSKFNKPVYLITYASWCITTKGELPALNELAEKYSDKIDFVILFWDDQKTARKAAKNYNKNITVLYVDEMENEDAFVVSKLKHSLGLPTTFLLDVDKKVLDIRRGVTHALNKSMEDSMDQNYNSIYDGIANHLLGEKTERYKPDPVAVN